MLKKACMGKNQVTEDQVGGIEKGKFIEDRNVMCYIACIYQMSQVVKNNKLNYEASMKQVDIMYPPELKDSVKKSILNCKHIETVKEIEEDKALSKEELHDISSSLIADFHECTKEFEISADDIKAAKAEKNIDKLDPCFIGCAFKRSGVVNEKGLFDKEKVLSFVNENLKNEDDKKMLSEIVEDCSKVNDEPVTDGENGCERSKLVLLCMMKHKDDASASDELKSIIQSKLVSSGLECIKDHPLSLSDIRAFKEKRIPNNEDAKCFTACLFKKIGIMDDMGKLNPANAREHAKQVFKGSEQHMKNADEIVTACSKVNDQMTSDGNKGCERAKLAFNCLTKNAAKYGFDFDVDV
ncbi:unnamed protein product [Diatraea saccharalis]|uniref:Uncharacterized protein n=1 Tax=Diatraea saccharalis TaxID=40085 RepID=A0A9N9WE16_9NEOP|nr:unnamed protein product [Diatraea saccharalis]